MLSIPSQDQISFVLGDSPLIAFNKITNYIYAQYHVEPTWKEAGKYGIWEVKYRKGGKTLCAFYIKEGLFTALIIFGKEEREKFESAASRFSSVIAELYANTQQYHDGKWLWIDVKDESMVDELKELIRIKRTL